MDDTDDKAKVGRWCRAAGLHLWWQRITKQYKAMVLILVSVIVNQQGQGEEDAPDALLKRRDRRAKRREKKKLRMEAVSQSRACIHTDNKQRRY